MFNSRFFFVFFVCFVFVRSIPGFFFFFFSWSFFFFLRVDSFDVTQPPLVSCVLIGAHFLFLFFPPHSQAFRSELRVRMVAYDPETYALVNVPLEFTDDLLEQHARTVEALVATRARLEEVEAELSSLRASMRARLEEVEAELSSFRASMEVDLLVVQEPVADDSSNESDVALNWEHDAGFELCSEIDLSSDEERLREHGWEVDSSSSDESSVAVSEAHENDEDEGGVVQGAFLLRRSSRLGSEANRNSHAIVASSASALASLVDFSRLESDSSARDSSSHDSSSESTVVQYVTGEGNNSGNVSVDEESVISNGTVAVGFRHVAGRRRRPDFWDVPDRPVRARLASVVFGECESSGNASSDSDFMCSESSLSDGSESEWSSGSESEFQSSSDSDDMS